MVSFSYLIFLSQFLWVILWLYELATIRIILLFWPLTGSDDQRETRLEIRHKDHFPARRRSGSEQDPRRHRLHHQRQTAFALQEGRRWCQVYIQNYVEGGKKSKTYSKDKLLQICVLYIIMINITVIGWKKSEINWSSGI